ncbi:MAG: hypothetical protein GY820_22085 [Gammaproteobacteria bacterium]|nr:hypothetical protein [Gammaproteobacteria bacterium]
MITRQDMEDLGVDYYTAPPAPKPPMAMVKEFSRIMGQEPDTELYSVLITEEFKEWYSEYFDETTEPQLKELADLVYVIYGYANTMGWDLDEALQRVHANNVGRCVQPDGTVKRREDGKILKNKDYPKVDLSDLV